MSSGVAYNEFKNPESGGPSITSYTLKNPSISATVISYGAILSHFTLGTGTESVDVALGFDDPFTYVEEGKVPGYPFLGAFVGRACNRTANGTFSLDGDTFHLPINNGPNSLHGGTVGFDKQFFKSEIVSQDPPCVNMEWVSPHLDQGFPGSLLVRIKYTLLGSELAINTMAELIDDKVEKTYVNLTSHPYFNLSGLQDLSVVDNLVHMQTSVEGCLELDDNQIPTGVVLTEKENPELFFYQATPLADSLPLVQKFRGFDHFYLVDRDDTRDLSSFISVSCPSSRVKLEVKSSSRGFQFYTGNWLDNRFKSKASQLSGSVTYGQYSGFCIEPSEPPNAINMPQYSSAVIITKGKGWNQQISYFLTKY